MTRLDAALAELAAAIRDEIADATHPAAPDRLHDLATAADLLGIGRTALYGELQAGRIRSLKVGRRRLVPASAIAERIGPAPRPYPHNKAARSTTDRTATADASDGSAAVPVRGTADGLDDRRPAQAPLRLPHTHPTT